MDGLDGVDRGKRGQFDASKVTDGIKYQAGLTDCSG